MDTRYATKGKKMTDLTWLKGRPIYASISGGKDSTALALHLKELGVAFTPVFIDTGWEHPTTYEYIDTVLTPLLGNIVRLRNEKLFDPSSQFNGGMEQMIHHHKMFPSGAVKFCTSELKVVPIQNYYAQERVRLGAKPVNCVGIRAEESAKRSTMDEIEEQDEATVWRPLISWTEANVVAIHHRHNVTPNPLYLKGASRVGCYPCIYARKHEIAHMGLTDPARIDHLADLEQRITTIREAEGKGPATFFKSRRPHLATMTIREIVAWAQGSADEEDLLHEIEDAGCMRWGMCERPTWQNLPLFREQE